MGHNPQESLENTIKTMGTLLGVHPIVPWIMGPFLHQDRCPKKNGLKLFGVSGVRIMGI